MSDFDINAHLGRIGFGSAKQDSGGSDGTNEKSTIDGAVEASGKATYSVAKVIGVPINLSDLGSVSITKPFDSEGLTGKMVMPSIMPDAQGGFLAKLLHSIFIKNREITDGTSGTGGSGGDSGNFGGGGGGGDFASGSGDFGGGGNFGGYDAFAAASNFGDFASQSGSYDWISTPMSSLGSLPRPITPDVSGGQSIEIG